jgi:hypothetical protein
LILSVRAAIAVPRINGLAARARCGAKCTSREPDHVEAVLLACVDDVERGCKAFGLAAAEQHWKFMIDA